MTDLVTWLRACAVENCGRTGKLSRGMCGKHYRYWLDHTPPEARGPSPREARNFWDFVKKTHDKGCWTWIGPRDAAGYGRWGRLLAHRWSWAHANGPIEGGLWVLHHCDNPPCVNPAHLYLGTALENVRDAIARGQIVIPPPRTHCKAGHEIAGSNLIEIRGTNGNTWRRCRTCDNARKAASARRDRRAKGLVRPPVTRSEETRIAELTTAGVSQRQIARQVGRALETVRRVLLDAGLR